MHKEQNQVSKEEKPFLPHLDPALRLSMSRIKYKVMIISGKGGVGKSTVAVNLAGALQKLKRTVGILDVDIHGPSVAKMLGIEVKQRLKTLGEKILPMNINGLKVITMAFLLDSPDTPVIWRGPMKMNVIRQFLRDVLWGDLDYLIIDSPPGTGDEPLSICQLIPEASGSVVVTTPQEVALLNSRKAVRFSQQLNIPVLGIVENMSGLKCPNCGYQIDLFKSGSCNAVGIEMGVECLGQIPIELQVVESTDIGKPFVFAAAPTPATKEMSEIARRIMELVEK